MSESAEPAVMTGFDEPATMQQCGAVAGQFTRLDYPRSAAGRARRLADSATLLGIPRLSSSTELTKGQAGRLLRMLRGCGTPEDLRALLGTIKGQARDGGTATVPRRPVIRRRWWHRLG
jgi:hypothetical protein